MTSQIATRSNLRRKSAGKHSPSSELKLAVFDSDLGAIAVVFDAKQRIVRLASGYPSASAALASLPHELSSLPRVEAAKLPLARRLQEFAATGADNLADIEIDSSWETPFAQKVLKLCRKIRPGKTLSYGELAAKAGSPGAARAVGSVMARNRVPLVVPCHRVIASGGRLGGYSGPTGLAMKRRLLDLEQAAVTR